MIAWMMKSGKLNLGLISMKSEEERRWPIKMPF